MSSQWAQSMSRIIDSLDNHVIEHDLVFWKLNSFIIWILHKWHLINLKMKLTILLIITITLESKKKLNWISLSEYKIQV